MFPAVLVVFTLLFPLKIWRIGEYAKLLAELFLEDDADALGVEGVAGEIAVVGLVVNLEGDDAALG